jgi:hypothetical protein
MGSLKIVERSCVNTALPWGFWPMADLANKTGFHRSVFTERTLGRDVLLALGAKNIGNGARGRHSFWVLPTKNAKAIVKITKLGFGPIHACRIVARRDQIVSVLECYN